MHLLIGALSVNSLSGWHVLASRAIKVFVELGTRIRFTVLVGRTNADLHADLSDSVGKRCPPIDAICQECRDWIVRNGNWFCRESRVAAMLSPSRTLSVGSVRQPSGLSEGTAISRIAYRLFPRVVFQFGARL